MSSESNGGDTYAYLYDTSGNQLESNDNGGDGQNFLIHYNLRKEKTYILGVKWYSASNTGTIPIRVSRTFHVTTLNPAFGVSQSGIVTNTVYLGYGAIEYSLIKMLPGNEAEFDGAATDNRIIISTYQNALIISKNVNIESLLINGEEEATHVITAFAGEGGAITPEGDIRVTSGSAQTYTVTPESGWQIRAVIVDGNDVGAVPSYTFRNVKKDHTISALFERTEWT